jgi:hypothetical protein
MPRLVRFRARARLWNGAATALGVLALLGYEAQAHKLVTSKYDYNKDIFPILRDRCGSCHVDGGVSPMSLLTYKDAVQWAASVREELVAERMPPWYVDPSGPPIKGGHPISPREIDMLVTWASGGTPQGDPQNNPPLPIAFHQQWKIAAPDLEVRMPGAQTLGPDISEESRDFILPTGLSETRWVKTVDLLAGTPSMVRDAIVSVDNGPVLAVWEPGSEATPAPSGAAFRLAAGVPLHLKMHYKKPWYDEGKAQSDQSTIGLYFTEAPVSGRGIEALSIDTPRSASEAPARSSLNKRLATAARVVAIRSSVDQPYASVEVQALTPSGEHVPLLALRAPRPAWPSRYWLQNPVDLPSGSEVEAIVTSAAPDPDEPNTSQPRRFEMAIELVPR